MAPIITLTTDFGLSDGYVGAMKGVIFSLCSDARIIDITHDIEPQDIQAGAYVLSTAAFRYPPGTIHVGVVDPGVGTARRGMILLSGGQVFVGPDNGLFTFAMDAMTAAFEIIAGPDISATFHGLDLFAPVAAKLAGGMNPSHLGSPMDNPVRLPCWTKNVYDDRVEGHVIHVDHFGDVITNLSPNDFPEPPRCFALPGRAVPPDLPILQTYGEAKLGQALWLVSSGGTYELAVRAGNAAADFEVWRGDVVVGYKKPA